MPRRGYGPRQRAVCWAAGYAEDVDRWWDQYINVNLSLVPLSAAREHGRQLRIQGQSRQRQLQGLTNITSIWNLVSAKMRQVDEGCAVLTAAARLMNDGEDDA